MQGDLNFQLNFVKTTKLCSEPTHKLKKSIIFYHLTRNYGEKFSME